MNKPLSSDADAIAEDFAAVGMERQRRAESPELQRRVHLIKDYQKRRFEQTYADLLHNPRYGPASRFFLEELYGPGDFSQRDEQFSQIIPVVTRLFSNEIAATVRVLASLHRLSESLDTAIARNLASEWVDASSYADAWRRTGCPQEREQQIALTLSLGAALDRLTRSALLKYSLRLMRKPAHLAGLGELQEILERGYDAFNRMQGAAEFLSVIADREHRLALALYRSPPDAFAELTAQNLEDRKVLSKLLP